MEDLESGLEPIRSAPAEAGEIRLIVRRPAEDQREVVQEAVLDVDEGLVGDTWRARGSGSTPDGSADPQAQVTLVNARAAAVIAGDVERWPLAGGQLFVDLDLSEENLPAGTRLTIGEAEIELSAKPHTGCAKYAARFGTDAL
jgi:MOSC domain-containing protein YiiM